MRTRALEREGLRKREEKEFGYRALLGFYSLLPLKESERLLSFYFMGAICKIHLQEHLNHLSLPERERRHKPNITLRPSCAKGFFIFRFFSFTC